MFLKVSRWIAVPIALYFLYFAVPALRAHFALDDPMNLGFYWRRGVARSIVDMFTFWTDSYRPAGALFYMPIYRVFGMNPLPYRIAILALVGLNVFLSFRIAMRLTGSLAGATLAAVLVCAHASMTPLYYNTSYIYDVLAVFFTALLMLLYMRWRASGGPTGVQAAILILVYIAAINSKEIAVAGALWILAYELIIMRGRAKEWAKRPARMLVPAILIGLAIAFTLTRALGAHSLSKQPGYELELTGARFLMNARRYVNDILYTEWFDTDRKLGMVYGLCTLFCVIARRRELWWTWILVSTAALPVMFTVNARTGASLYLPLLALALWVSTAATIFLRRWPIREWAAVVLVAALVVPTTIDWFPDRGRMLMQEQEKTWSAIKAMRALPRPKHGSTVLFLSNPFADWDMSFIAMLVWDDPTIDVRLANKLDPPPDPAKFDWVLAFEGDKLNVVRSPEHGS